MTTTSSQNQAAKLLIIGDIVIDETWHVRATKLSPEGPIPVVILDSDTPEVKAGGAGLAARYATKNKIPVHLMTACSLKNKDLLESNGIPTTSIDDTDNIVKKRYIDIESGYHLMRVDNDSVVSVPDITTDNIYSLLKDFILQNNVSMVSMLDYRKGVFFDRNTCQSIIRLCRSKDIFTYVDTRCLPTKFIGADYIKLNATEYDYAKNRMNTKDMSEMRHRLEANSLIVTLGKDGAMMTSQNCNNTSYVPKLRKTSHAPDVTGCGDVFGINFCTELYEAMTKKSSLGNAQNRALRIAVEKATSFAYEDTRKRL